MAASVSAITPRYSSICLVLGEQLLTRATPMPRDLSLPRNSAESSYRWLSSRRCSASVLTRVSTKAGDGAIPHACKVRANDSAMVSFPSPRSVPVLNHCVAQVAGSMPMSAVKACRRDLKSELRIVSYTSTRHALTTGSALRELGPELTEVVVGEPVPGEPPLQAAVADVELLEKRLHRLFPRQVRLDRPAAHVGRVRL